MSDSPDTIRFSDGYETALKTDYQHIEIELLRNCGRMAVRTHTSIKNPEIWHWVSANFPALLAARVLMPTAIPFTAIHRVAQHFMTCSRAHLRNCFLIRFHELHKQDRLPTLDDLKTQYESRLDKFWAHRKPEDLFIISPQFRRRLHGEPALTPPKQVESQAPLPRTKLIDPKTAMFSRPDASARSTPKDPQDTPYDEETRKLLAKLSEDTEDS